MDSLIAPLLTAIATVLTAVYLLRDQRRKLGAETDSLVVGAAGDMIRTLQSEVGRMCARVEELEVHQESARVHIEELQVQVIKLTRENETLRARVDTLETENLELRAENAKLRGPR